MDDRLRPPLLQQLLIVLLALGLGAGWLLPSDVDARTADLGHNEVPVVVFENISLKLVGTAVTRDPDKRLAVIEDLKSRQQWSFHEGDRVGGILIKSILRDHIVIDAGKGDETVKIRSYLGQGRSTPASPNVPPQRDLSGPSATPINRVGSRDRHYLIDREQAAIGFADPEEVLDQVDITPGRFLNRETGFRITSFEPGSIYTQMGLRSGDLILGINDQEITGPEDAASFFETIGEGGDIDLKVRRRARTYHFHLQIQ